MVEETKINYRSVNFRLYPTAIQQRSIEKNIHSVRFVYNKALEAMIASHKAVGYPLSYNELSELLTQWKESWRKDDTTKWLTSGGSASYQQALMHVVRAFQNYRSSRKAGSKQKWGYPRFKSIKRSRLAFKTLGVNLRVLPEQNLKQGLIQLPKHGLIQARGPFEYLARFGKISSATVYREAGKYYASILVEDTSKPTNEPVEVEACGIDIGVKTPLQIVYRESMTDSSLNRDKSIFIPYGEKEQARLKKLEARRHRYQRAFARKMKKSKDATLKALNQCQGKNRYKAQVKVQRAFQCEANFRKDWQEKMSHGLTKTVRYIVFEDLKLRNMTAAAKPNEEGIRKGRAAKAGLNRELLRMGFSRLVTRCQQKAEQRSRKVFLVDPKYTSQTCFNCGTVDSKSRKTQARFECVHCTYKENADKNAALNILAKAKADIMMHSALQ